MKNIYCEKCGKRFLNIETLNSELCNYIEKHEVYTGVDFDSLYDLTLEQLNEELKKVVKEKHEIIMKQRYEQALRVRIKERIIKVAINFKSKIKTINTDVGKFIFHKSESTNKFICERCNKNKVSKTIVEWRTHSKKDKKICNGCYGFLLSNK